MSTSQRFEIINDSDLDMVVAFLSSTDPRFAFPVTFEKGTPVAVPAPVPGQVMSLSFLNPKTHEFLAGTQVHPMILAPILVKNSYGYRVTTRYGGLSGGGSKS